MLYNALRPTVLSQLMLPCCLPGSTVNSKLILLKIILEEGWGWRAGKYSVLQPKIYTAIS